MSATPQPQLFVNRKIGYYRHQQSGGGNIDVAEDFAGVAVAQASLMEKAEARRDFPMRTVAPTFADRAESGVQFVSRWAGILAFVGTIAAIAYLIF